MLDRNWLKCHKKIIRINYLMENFSWFLSEVDFESNKLFFDQPQLILKRSSMPCRSCFKILVFEPFFYKIVILLLISEPFLGALCKFVVIFSCQIPDFLVQFRMIYQSRASNSIFIGNRYQSGEEFDSQRCY